MRQQTVSSEQFAEYFAALHGAGLTHVYRQDTGDSVSRDFRGGLTAPDGVKIDLAINQVMKRGERIAVDRVVDFDIPFTVDEETGDESVDDQAFWDIYDQRIEATPIKDKVFSEISDQLFLSNLDKLGHTS